MSNPQKFEFDETPARTQVADTALLPREIWIACEPPFSVGFAYDDEMGDLFPFVDKITKFSTAQDIWVGLLAGTGTYTVWVWENPEGLL